MTSNRLNLLTTFVLVSSLLAAAPASAVFHEWKIKEVYSNADGSIQYIELFTTEGGQEFLGNHTLASNGRSFTIPNDLLSGTANKHVLFATPGFEKLAGAVEPDYVLPCGPFFDPDGDTINFSNFDMVTFGSGELPSDGSSSLTDSNLGAGTSLSSGTSSPINYAGAIGSVAVTGCLLDGTCDACNNNQFCDGEEVCNAGSCEATAPCDGLSCDEAEDECFECTDEADCNDDNPCTDDSCSGERACEHVDNTADCDDGHFCTTTDVCSAGTCTGTGDPCNGAGCNEGSETCGDCAGDPDCDDGDYCNGEETCNAGTCEAGSAPCDANDQTCDEAEDACVNICGNGEVQSGEECDDSNTDDDDGCSPTCQVEDGWQCETDSGTSVCTEVMTPAPDAGSSSGGDDAGPGADGGMMSGGERDAGDDEPDSGGPSSMDRDGGDGPGKGPSSMDRDGGDVGADGGTDTGEDSEDSGCSCRMVRADRAQDGRAAWLGVLVLGVALGLRRRSRVR